MWYCPCYMIFDSREDFVEYSMNLPSTAQYFKNLDNETIERFRVEVTKEYQQRINNPSILDPKSFETMIIIAHKK